MFFLTKIQKVKKTVRVCIKIMFEKSLLKNAHKNTLPLNSRVKMHQEGSVQAEAKIVITQNETKQVEQTNWTILIFQMI